ncbi:lysophospholipid acyltransferase family protein [Desulforamulus ruminis]|uniref:1-acyl-sn-glycerol-3-phosphate acyltransferase n=1 Tax=Desulforamulus ruminis (strain ATCC 23193 / DSM 2154 / NCIMB 8452 / DL) TaxID=696281 RepID=F6DT59_DESRL|nr:lysophospholipid acyltransferase family protein [Desulforamulus ruminis]AEG61164.1 1-acyl-sn-glycerol-3-phosphate acyltransferase [Desulforamulus ruminis DSM 2154]
MIYSFLWRVIRLILLIWRRWQVIGVEHLPQRGGVVVVSNHVSNLDPVVVGCALTRPIHFMAKIELFKISIIGWFLRQLKSFPIHRDKSDRQAIRTALELLQSGEVLGIFPEGTRSKSGELQKPHIGAALLAVKADVPILPIALKGTKGFFTKIVVLVGEPIYLPEVWHNRPGKEELEKLSEQAMGQVAALLNK